MSPNSHKISSLEIQGYLDWQVENKFFRQEQLSEALAIILPGRGYTCDMPVLYYTTELFLQQHKVDVLQLWVDYSTPDFQAALAEEQGEWLRRDAQALIEEGQNQRNYSQLFIVGKSLGTITMAELIIQNVLPGGTKTIWLTPLLLIARVVEAIKSLGDPALVIGGSGDRAYDPEIRAQIQELSHVTTITIEGSDHSLEIPGDLPSSIRSLEDVLRAINQFTNQ